MLNQDFSTATSEHLNTCAGCRDFQRQQMKLRQIVGGLGTVNAPADFDFRLRARLAADSQEPSFRFRTFAVKGLATAAVLVVFGVGAVVVWQRTHEQKPVVADVQPQVAQPAQVAPPQVTEPTQHEDSVHDGLLPGRSNPVVADDTTPRRRNDRAVAVNKPVRVATIDSSSERAPRFTNTDPAVDTSTAFPIEASSQSLKVSLDDGRGNARTISFPTVSFGSQRVLTGANQFAPKGAW